MASRDWISLITQLGLQLSNCTFSQYKIQGKHGKVQGSFLQNDISSEYPIHAIIKKGVPVNYSIARASRDDGFPVTGFGTLNLWVIEMRQQPVAMVTNRCRL